ncbi:MAG: porin [Pseudohongiellaceae bacterium]|jgi:hypothetical protein
MRFSLPPRPLLLALALLLARPGVAAESDLELYLDTTTRQLYAEPGPGRVSLGTFRPVASTETAPAGTATASSIPAVAALETRVAQHDERLATLAAAQSKSGWTQNLQIRGYLQNRYTEMLGGDEGVNLWADRSVGDQNSLGDADKNYLIRRARVIIQGDIGKRLSIYIQPDLASSAGTTGQVAQLRDAYGDFYLTEDRVHRLRVGQSKVPYGFENMQSSSNRLALDRADALNSAVRDERDLGAFYYYTPVAIQTLFNEINAAGLKHSGNYGMFGVGLYNGQGANRADRNDNQHVVTRLTYPWKLASGQYLEAGLQAYSGEYAPTLGAYRGTGNQTRTPTVAAADEFGLKDQRVGVSFMLYPQPFGLQGEWNWGTTPALDIASNSLVEDSLNGGYLQAMYMAKTGVGTVLPFVRWQYFDGANKAETNAPMNHVNDLEIGVEWQIAREVELSAIFHRMKRNNLVTGNRAGRPDYAEFEADALRLQLQFNYQ